MKSALLACAGVLAAARAATAVDVLVLSSTDQAVDDAVVQALESRGHQATIGPAFSNFTDAVDLGAYDVVYFQANVNWPNPDMPESGQDSLLAFIDAGGGLVTGEWVSFRVGPKLHTLHAALPVLYQLYGSSPSTTFTQVTPDAVLNKGLAGTLEFPLDYYGGSESLFVPKCGAAVYYRSATQGPGAVGWHYGVGRVLSFSTVNGPLQAADPEFGTLLSNAMSWAALGGGGQAGFSADCDGSGLLDLFDFLCYANAFNAGDPGAECDGDDGLSLFDFLCFVNLFNAGC
jgi:hypothetical protein